MDHNSPESKSPMEIDSQNEEQRIIKTIKLIDKCIINIDGE
jgi:hypothetical protein